MSNLVSLNVKIDRDVKAEADNMFNSMGMTLSTAINIFVRQAVKERAIPFTISAEPSKQSIDSGFLLREALKEAQDQAVINGTSEITLNEINDIISEVRRENRG